ncbi:phage tail assembly protein [Desmonostoc muscorum LEGE 12446]|nr:phage tail assembly protein [Desmonostoc muscorum LEGE 12446]
MIYLPVPNAQCPMPNAQSPVPNPQSPIPNPQSPVPMPRKKDNLCTEFAFTLPRGLSDGENRVHRQGVMRLATAKDEILVQQERKVQENPTYGALVMLARVITRLGSLNSVSPELLEGLLLHDIAYLREFYNRINQQGDVHIPAQCPHCNTQFSVELELAGES